MVGARARRPRLVAAAFRAREGVDIDGLASDSVKEALHRISWARRVQRRRPFGRHPPLAAGLPLTPIFSLSTSLAKTFSTALVVTVLRLLEAVVLGRVPVRGGPWPHAWKLWWGEKPARDGSQLR